jgi:Acetyltransferase (GNAT) domain
MMIEQGNLALTREPFSEAPLARVQLEPWSEARADWIELVSRTREASVFHGHRWIESILAAYRFKTYVATLRTARGSLVAGLPLAQSIGLTRRRLVAFPYSDFCPPLEEEAGAADALVTGLAALAGLPPVEIRGYDAPAPWHKFEMFERWATNIEGSPVEVQQRFTRNFRREIRRAEGAGFEVARVTGPEGLRRFYDLIADSRLRKGLPTQPPAFFRAVAEGMGEQAEVWLSSLNGRDMAVEFALVDGGSLYGKWMARAHDAPPGATQLLIWMLIRAHMGECRVFDVGRTDIRNEGLANFKRQHGAKASPLPYLFFPDPPGNISSEHVTGARAVVSRAWAKLPMPAATALSAFIYRYLS